LATEAASWASRLFKEVATGPATDRGAARYASLAKKSIMMGASTSAGAL
jgi:hypothetical protein